jgi:nucleoprotein TPR
LQSEATQLAVQLSDALAERDASAASSQEASQKLGKMHKENELLQTQLNDLGRQIQTLLKELARAKDPMLPTDEELERDEETQAPSNIDEVITNELVLFRSIPDLQARNQQLLQLVRQLGNQMESEEKEYRAEMEKEQADAIREAHDAIQELQAQLETEKKAGEVRYQTLVKERDSLKALLERAQRIAPGANGNMGSIIPAASDSELAKELADIQFQFDAYRNEIGIDAGRLREENVNLQREIAQLNTALAKANANTDFLNGTYLILHHRIQRLIYL